MQEYYYSDDWEFVENYIGGGEETIIEAFQKIPKNDKALKKKIKLELLRIGFKL